MSDLYMLVNPGDVQSLPDRVPIWLANVLFFIFVFIFALRSEATNINLAKKA